jgi:MscS family membrane protein
MLLLGLLAGAAAGQGTASVLPGDALGRDNPRSAMRGYLEACRAGEYEKAAQYMDLGRMPRARGATLARQLKTVLDRVLWVELEQLSEAPEGTDDDGLPRNRDLVGTIGAKDGPVGVFVERRREAGKQVWKIASATVADIPALHEEFGDGPLAEMLPPLFFEIHFLEVQLWQWIGLLVLVVVAAAVSWILTFFLFRIARGLAARSQTEVDDAVLHLAAGPVRLLVAVLAFAGTTYPLGLAVPARAFLGAVEKGLVILATTWLLLRVIDLAARFIERRMFARGQAMALSVVPLGRRTVKVLVTAIALLAALQNFGVNVTGILAGLGIGGLAVALAAQKTVENLFGGVTLIADQPVRVGDFCRFGDKIGTVEEVGLRSTRVRTLDRTVVTVPNAEFSSLQLEKFTRRDRIWFHPSIGLRYETSPDQLRFVLVEVKKLLATHPKVDPEPARVRFTGFGDFSLNLEIFAYVRTNDYNEFLAIQEDLLLRIMDIVEHSGSGFAFPSQTIYTGPDTGLDAARTKAAEEQVNAWRQASELGRPSRRRFAAPQGERKVVVRKRETARAEERRRRVSKHERFFTMLFVPERKFTARRVAAPRHAASRESSGARDRREPGLVAAA